MTEGAAATEPRAQRFWRRNQRLIGVLLALWFAVTFGVAFFARELRFEFFGTPFSFWVASQGALVVYLAIVVVYIWQVEKLDDGLVEHRD
jgi:putative solute:sodium symporter small subunit